MKIEEAIEFLQQYTNNEVYTEKCVSAHAIAITALRSMQEAGEPLSLEQLREVPHGKIKDSTLQNIANRVNEIAFPPAHIDRSEWISVKERLPERFKPVLICREKTENHTSSKDIRMFANGGKYMAHAQNKSPTGCRCRNRRRRVANDTP